MHRNAFGGKGSLRARYRPIRTSRILPDVILTLVHSTRLLPCVVKIMSVPRSVSRAIPRPPLAVNKRAIQSAWKAALPERRLTSAHGPQHPVPYVPYVPYVPFRWQTSTFHMSRFWGLNVSKTSFPQPLSVPPKAFLCILWSRSSRRRAKFGTAILKFGTAKIKNGTDKLEIGSAIFRPLGKGHMTMICRCGMKNSERCGFRYHSAEFKGLRTLQFAPHRLKWFILAAFGRGGLEETSSSSMTTCVVQRDVNEWREATHILRSGNAPKNAKRSKGRFGEAEPIGRSGVCARAPLIGVCSIWNQRGLPLTNHW